MREHLGKDILVALLSKFPTVGLRSTVKRVQSRLNSCDLAVIFSIMTPSYGKDMEHDAFLLLGAVRFALHRHYLGEF